MCSIHVRMKKLFIRKTDQVKQMICTFHSYLNELSFQLARVALQIALEAGLDRL